MAKLKKALDDSWESVRPQRRGTGSGNGQAPRAPTPRDANNVALSGALVIVLVWIFRITFDVQVPAEIAVAFGTIVGYAVGRMFRY